MKLAALLLTLAFSFQASAYVTGAKLEKLMLQTGTCYGASQKAGTNYSWLGYTFLPNGELEIQLTNSEYSLKAYNSAYSNAAGYTEEEGTFVKSQWRVKGAQVHIKLSSGWKNLVVNFDKTPSERLCNYYSL